MLATMGIAIALERMFKWLLIGSLAAMGAAWLNKDRWPDPGFYDATRLRAPLQQPGREHPFTTEVGGIVYRIEPRYSYELNGVVVSYHDADAIDDIWHHDSWQDFLNIRDVCVIWGRNVASGVYRDSQFHNDSWTCWAFWPNRATRDRFHLNELSNNHLLADDPLLQERIMQAEPGDQIRVRGFLANYRNPATGAYRRTSTTREDTGNGACETVYVQDFEILGKANAAWRRLYRGAGILALISLLGLLIMLTLTPVRRGLR